jgi:hypothetical protein
MSVFHENMLIGSSGQGAPAAAGISRSLRFNSADSASLSRTPASAGNRRTWTWAGWVKPGGIGTVRQIFTSRPSASPYALFYIYSDDKIHFSDNALNTHMTAAVYRDPSAWYHIQLAIDTTDATAANRVRLWINGTLQTWGSTTAPTQNADGQINTAAAHSIGSPQPYANGEYFSGYLADIYLIDGQALDPSSFTETDATTGQLIPKAYTGSYGTNGFHLEFADNSSNTATTLGKDTSGNGNNWTPNNLSVTAGTGNDSLVDVPTNGAQTDTGVGGEVRGNYCTWNPLKKVSSATAVNGNLAFTVPNDGGIASTFAVSSGKWYWEVVLSSGRTILGLATTSWDPAVYPGNTAQGWGYSAFNGNKIHNASSTSYGSSFTTGDVIGVAFNADAGTLTFYKNGTSQGQAFTGITGSVYQPALGGDGGTTGAGDANFGQRAFAYTAPSGFKALNTANLPAPLVTKPSTVMDVALYTGNGSARSITGLGFNPDLVWIKSRSAATDHELTDSVRGTTKSLSSNLTAAEATDTGGLTAFNSDGFSLGTDTKYNNNAATYVAWAWDAGTTTDPNNTAGSISSQVRANASAGFSVMTYTGQTAAGTIGHGLGVAPSLIITKARSNAQSWGVYHKDVGINNYLLLDSTGASTSYSGIWGSSAPTSTVFGVPGNVGLNNNNGWTYVAYCFAPVVGYSSFGSFSGGSNVFTYTGFRPKWLLIKLASSSGTSWIIYDSVRDSYNVMGRSLYANLSDSEFDSPPRIDFLSNGFVTRASSPSEPSYSGTVIYASFAETPFNYARAR